ncbi:MAG: hypothetical protein AAF741_15195 [Bacteroidota bacterium]
MDVAIRPALHNVVDFLASSPSPSEILAFKAQKEDSDRFEQLVAAQKNGANLSIDEQSELKDFFFIHHIMIVAKARAKKLLANG